jgi:hypothetical protein
MTELIEIARHASGSKNEVKLSELQFRPESQELEGGGMARISAATADSTAIDCCPSSQLMFCLKVTSVKTVEVDLLYTQGLLRVD